MMICAVHVRRMLAIVAATALFSAGCAEPQIPQSDTTPSDNAAEALDETDQFGDALSDAITDLTGTLTAINTVLATNATDVESLKAAADTALDLLLFNNPAVFPATPGDSERDGSGDDLLTVVLTAARQKGGLNADMVTSALRDTLAGDLGAWERDPESMRTLALTAFGPTPELTTQRAAQLQADGMRAIAWLAFARTQQSVPVIREALANAQTHLDIVSFSVQVANAA